MVATNNGYSWKTKLFYTVWNNVVATSLLPLSKLQETILSAMSSNSLVGFCLSSLFSNVPVFQSQILLFSLNKEHHVEILYEMKNKLNSVPSPLIA